MNNYIVTIELYQVDGLVRRTQMNLRHVTITDLKSARKAIDEQLLVDGFEYTEKELSSYYITMLAKVND